MAVKVAGARYEAIKRAVRTEIAAKTAAKEGVALQKLAATAKMAVKVAGARYKAIKRAVGM
ncbi:hypothetical protein [Paenibacillus sp. NPDC058071]|uniref:hypothetical protein n=1 Tax=Paenibacillus sp. NPDC058071 TaxID=3346326 RepID=UPI0036D95AD4